MKPAVTLLVVVVALLAVVVSARGPAVSTAQGTVFINFESDPGPNNVIGDLDDVLLPTGTPISNQFRAAAGVRFFLVDDERLPFIGTEGCPFQGFTVGKLSLEICDVPSRVPPIPTTAVNTLTDGLFQAEYGARFSPPVSSVKLSLIDFGDAIPAVLLGQPVTATLKAFDRNGNLVDSDDFTIPRYDGDRDPPDINDGNIAPLEVFGPATQEGFAAVICSVETALTSRDGGTAIDDFTFEPGGGPGGPGTEFFLFPDPCQPAPVGGTTELLVEGSDSPGDASASSARDYTAPIAAAVAVGALAIAAGGWYARRRWLR